MKNKRAKQMIIFGVSYAHGIRERNLWWDGSSLMHYEPPHGYFEGDEYQFFWYFMTGQITSLTADQIKGKRNEKQKSQANDR